VIKEICIWLVAIIEIGFVVRFISNVRKKETTPPVTTWFIFLLGTGISIGTYVTFKKHDLQSGILNIMDFTCTGLSFVAVWLWGNRSVPFTVLEKFSIIVAICIVMVWKLTENAMTANLLAQMLIMIGYIPTIHRMISWKKNTESFQTWSIVLLAGFVGLVPAILDYDTLAVIYALRGIIMVSLVMCVSAHYALQAKIFLSPPG